MLSFYFDEVVQKTIKVLIWQVIQTFMSGGNDKNLKKFWAR